MIAALLFVAGSVLIFIGLAGLRDSWLRGEFHRARKSGEVKVPQISVPKFPPFQGNDTAPKPEVPIDTLTARFSDPHAPNCQACNRRMRLERDATVLTATEAICRRQYECEECQTVATVVVRGRVYSYTVEIKDSNSRKLSSLSRPESRRSEPEQQK